MTASGPPAYAPTALPPYSQTDPLHFPPAVTAKPWGSHCVAFTGEQIDTESAHAAATTLATNHSVTTFSLAGNNASVTDEFMPTLTRALIANTTLVSLNLSSCSISTKGAALLGIALRNNNTLQALFVQDNAFLEEGSIAFAKALLGPLHSSQNVVLTTLNLSGNAIFDDGFAAIAHVAIRSLPSLRHLSVVANAITDKSAMLIAHLVAAHPSLQTLQLQQNWLTNASVLAVDRVLTPSSTIRNVNFIINRITLKSRMVRNKSVIWWKPKHQTTYGSVGSATEMHSCGSSAQNRRRSAPPGTLPPSTNQTWPTSSWRSSFSWPLAWSRASWLTQ